MLYEALAAPGVAKAARLNVDFAYLKRPDGGTESVIVVGFDLNQEMGGPWNVVAGDIRSLRFPETIMIDDLYREKLGVNRLGDIVEINGHRARVVGFTHGVRSFTQSPYVFASSRTAAEYSHIRPDQTKFILVRLRDGIDLNAGAAALARAIPDVEVRTTADFRRLTQFYWIFTTGAGMAILIAALLGLVVGVVIVSQTLYATTIDHLGEFATLRAIGGSNRFIYGVIIRQALLSAIIGYAIGLVVILAILRATADSAAALVIPPWMVVAMLALTIGMCVTAAIISIRKVTRLDPVTVFK